MRCVRQAALAVALCGMGRRHRNGPSGRAHGTFDRRAGRFGSRNRYEARGRKLRHGDDRPEPGVIDRLRIQFTVPGSGYETEALIDEAILCASRNAERRIARKSLRALDELEENYWRNRYGSPLHTMTAACGDVLVHACPGWRRSTATSPSSRC
jgi:hypothetical protein